MDKITDVLRDSKRLRLIATALELMQYERTDSAVIPITGTEPQRYVTIGTAATVAQLLEIDHTPAGPSVPQAWREFASGIRDLPVGAEPNLDGMRAKARQLLANEERRAQEGGGT